MRAELKLKVKSFWTNKDLNCELFEATAPSYLQGLKMSQVAEVAGLNMKKGIVGDISATVNNKIVTLSQLHTQQLSEK